MASYDPLYLGFDLSTQQLKAVAVTSDLKVACEVKFDFDVDSRDFGVEHGVLTNDGEHEVYAPVVMWLQAVDRVLEQLQKSKGDFRRIGGISGAGQRHGSVYWNAEGERVLQNLDPTKKLQHSSSRHSRTPLAQLGKMLVRRRSATNSITSATKNLLSSLAAKRTM
jgi:xylulokinase